MALLSQESFSSIIIPWDRHRGWQSVMEKVFYVVCSYRVERVTGLAQVFTSGNICSDACVIRHLTSVGTHTWTSSTCHTWAISARRSSHHGCSATGLGTLSTQNSVYYGDGHNAMEEQKTTDNSGIKELSGTQGRKKCDHFRQEIRLHTSALGSRDKAVIGQMQLDVQVCPLVCTQTLPFSPLRRLSGGHAACKDTLSPCSPRH